MTGSSGAHGGSVDDDKPRRSARTSGAARRGLPARCAARLRGTAVRGPEGDVVRAHRGPSYVRVGARVCRCLIGILRVARRAVAHASASTRVSEGGLLPAPPELVQVGFERRRMGTCRWRVSIEASLNHSPSASSLSACSSPPGRLRLSAGYDVTRLLGRRRMAEAGDRHHLPAALRAPPQWRCRGCSGVACYPPRDF